VLFVSGFHRVPLTSGQISPPTDPSGQAARSRSHRQTNPIPTPYHNPTVCLSIQHLNVKLVRRRRSGVFPHWALQNRSSMSAERRYIKQTIAHTKLARLSFSIMFPFPAFLKRRQRSGQRAPYALMRTIDCRETKEHNNNDGMGIQDD
jgi:hypothetical protein